MQIGEVWTGKAGTPYECVSAKIEAITARNVKFTFDTVVTVDGMMLGGDVITHKQFKLHFDPGEQLSLFI